MDWNYAVNGVDEIREIQTSQPMPQVVRTYKVYIIDEVHMLRDREPFNALLKTLKNQLKCCFYSGDHWIT